MWFYYFRNTSRMTVHWFLNTVIMDVENRFPGKRQVRSINFTVMNNVLYIIDGEAHEYTVHPPTSVL